MPFLRSGKTLARSEIWTDRVGSGGRCSCCVLLTVRIVKMSGAGLTRGRRRPAAAACEMQRRAPAARRAGWSRPCAAERVLPTRRSLATRVRISSVWRITTGSMRQARDERRPRSRDAEAQHPDASR